MAAPLVRLLLHFGVTYPVFAELMKRVYVETAEREFALSDRDQTVSRLSLLTGIHRQDINRLRELNKLAEAAIDTNSALSPRLIGRWLRKPFFCDGRFQFVGLSDAAQASLVAAATESSMQHLKDLNELAADDDSATTNRISVGVFVFHERKSHETNPNA
jgi:hypothetical protein